MQLENITFEINFSTKSNLKQYVSNILYLYTKLFNTIHTIVQYIICVQSYTWCFYKCFKKALWLGNTTTLQFWVQCTPRGWKETILPVNIHYYYHSMLLLCIYNVFIVIYVLVQHSDTHNKTRSKLPFIGLVFKRITQDIWKMITSVK